MPYCLESFVSFEKQLRHVETFLSQIWNILKLMHSLPVWNGSWTTSSSIPRSRRVVPQFHYACSTTNTAQQSQLRPTLTNIILTGFHKALLWQRLAKLCLCWVDSTDTFFESEIFGKKAPRRMLHTAVILLTFKLISGHCVRSYWLCCVRSGPEMCNHT